MADRDEILRFLDRLLQPAAFSDYCPNGLQVPGDREVARVVTGVSATLDLFTAARERQADLILVHHGIFWNGNPEALSATQAARIKLLLTHDINLVAYHLPLDAHAEVGNNSLLGAALGLTPAAPFGEHKGDMVGWICEAPEPIDSATLRTRIESATDRRPLFFDHGPTDIKRVGIISGAAAGHLQEAIDSGCDAFITGEPAEPVMADSKEAGIHFAAAGHYATETFGVRRLGELLAEKFGVSHEFLQISNPI
ncbi:MAG: Nif3-like dinuclear metal center hexameric protein [Solirubrobacterales bacterium]